jgi:hypothetical protein
MRVLNNSLGTRADRLRNKTLKGSGEIDSMP